MSGDTETSIRNGQIRVILTHDLDPSLYDLPLSLRTWLPERWKKVQVTQEGETLTHTMTSDDSGRRITYQAEPKRGPVLIQRSR